MIVCQLLFFLNHIRLLLDAGHCSPPAGSTGLQSPISVPSALAAYPCSAGTPARLGFVAAHAGGALSAAFALPLGELWVPVVTVAILLQLHAILLLPSRLYLAYARRPCMAAVGLLPKVVSLVSFLAFPAVAPSSYFSTYLPLEGAITVWQQLVYNYPFWPGMVVLTAHCALSTLTCLWVGTATVAAAPSTAPLFSVPWVLLQTYFSAGLAAAVSLQQNPAVAQTLLAALRAGGGNSATTAVSAAGGSAESDAARLAQAAHKLQLLNSSSLGRSMSSCGGGLDMLASLGSFLSSAGSSTAPSAAPSAPGSGDNQAAAAMAKAAAAAAAGGSRQAGPSCAGPCGGAGACVATPPQHYLHRDQVRDASRMMPSALQQHQHMLQLQLQLQAQAQAQAHAMRPPQQFTLHAQAHMAHHRVEPYSAFALASAGASSASTLVSSHAGVASIQASAAKLGAATQAPFAPGDPMAAAQLGVPAPMQPRAQQTSAPAQRMAAPTPPSLAFSLKQPTGLSKLTIVEDQEFQGPPAAALSNSLAAVHALAARQGRHQRYRSRAPPQRVYMKIPWAEPDQLPRNFLERLNMALSEGVDCMAVGVAARAGCIELVFDVVQRGNRGATAAAAAAMGIMIAGVDSGTSTGYKLAGGQGANDVADLLWSGGSGRMAVAAVGADATGSADGAGVGLGTMMESHSALEEAACGRLFISKWNHVTRAWIPEKAECIRPSDVPRITSVDPPCVLVSRQSGVPVAPQPVAAVTLTVSNADSSPAFSARCRGRYLSIVTCPLRPLGTTWPSMASGSQSLPVRTSPLPLSCVTGNWDDSAVNGSPPSAAPNGTGDVGVKGGEGEGGSSGDDSAFRLGSVRPGMASVRLELPAGLPSNGLMVLECKVGKLLSNWRPIIVTDDAQLAAELSSLAAPPAASGSSANESVHGDAVNSDDLFTDLGLWLDFVEVLGLNSREGGRTPADNAAVSLAPGSADLGHGLAALYATERYKSHMAGIAVSLLEFAVDRGWTHIASVLVSQLLAAGVSWAEVLGRCSGGLTLLHRAVRSAHEGMVAQVVRWGEENGTPFDWQAACQPGDVSGEISPTADNNGAGVTPLHLAAALPDGGRLAERILREYEAACSLWASALDRHGMRPLDCARASGHTHLITGSWTATAAAAGSAVQAPAGLASVAAPAAVVSSGGGDDAGEGSSASMTESMALSGASSYVGAAAGAAGISATPSPRATARRRRGDAESPASALLSPGASVMPSGAGVAAAQQSRSMLLEVAAAFAAPMVNSVESEASYVKAVGMRYVMWSCGYLVYQVSMVTAVAGRMVKEGRAHEMVGMLIFCAPHVLSAVLVCVNYAAWLRCREVLCALVTITRSSAKLLPVLGLLPYPHSSTTYMTWGMDVLLEGVAPAFFEQVRAPFALLLRLFEGVATGLLYQRLGVVPSLPYALSYGLCWTLCCGLLTASLDVRHRAMKLGQEGTCGGSAAEGAARPGGSAVQRYAKKLI
ncbi:hypothetical protein HYH03_017803 [Edaphochlamys debaryana]|uniref:Uncharacterized protein n=1 Tax=Edaphochlamys debaryana TaxID=47281 RepID=A0A835XH82_9CHLO|nr:hypothetical protein HYH03_017803 [Edaphochlamys debaryana]|eukprot:KAG2483300.1 hypothetical protein HYH03_017803 [Edaphochlamys debaryana]